MPKGICNVHFNINVPHISIILQEKLWDSCASSCIEASFDNLS
jgi:hypothetical protein